MLANKDGRMVFALPAPENGQALTLKNHLKTPLTITCGAWDCEAGPGEEITLVPRLVVSVTQGDKRYFMWTLAN